MRKLSLVAAMLFAALSAFAGVSVSSPSSGSTVGSPVHFVASASSSANSIASMIIYVDGNKMYTKYASSLDTYISLGNGSHYVVTKAWDNSGNVFQDTRTIYVSGSSSSSSGSGVTISSPSSGSSVTSPVHFVASATPSGSYPIASMKMYVDGNDGYLAYSNKIDTYVSMGSGSHYIVIKAWDNSGKVYQATENISVGSSSSSSSSGSSSSSSTGTTIYSIQAMSGWQDCATCASTPSGTGGATASYSITQNESSPSLDGKTTQYWIGGSNPYADVLFYKGLTSTMGTTAVQNAHHFIYDAYFYIKYPQYAQSLEFDINQYVNGKSLVFGTQCNLLNGHQWDYWDNVHNAWVHSGIYCGTPSAYTWHHVIVEVERDTSTNWLHYISVTLDGNKQYIDKWEAPGSSSWTAMTVNFQMDGDYAMHDYSVWLDKLNFIYW